MPAKIPKPNEAVLQARARRGAAAAGKDVRIEWFIDQVVRKVGLSMKGRMKLATEMVRDKVVRNISSPVMKGTGPRGGKVVTGRSKPGEYLHAETTQLMKTTFSEVRRAGKDIWDGYVGTPLDYGLIWELRGTRKYLTATMTEMRPIVKRILTAPIR